jgi:hypothetical protein
MVRKIREDNYKATKDLTFDQRKADLGRIAARVNRKARALKKK